MLQYTLFIFFALVSAAVMAVTIVYTFQRRATPGARSLMAYLGVVGGFLVGNTLELVDPSQAGTLFWAKFNYFFITSLPVTWLAFTFEYTGRKRWLGPTRFWVAGVIPLITFIFALTTEMHGLVWERYSFVPVGPFLAIDVVHGPWFWVAGIYTYVCIIAGAVVMWREHFLAPAPRLYRRRTALLIAGGLFPLVFNLIYVYHVVPGWNKDYTPVAFALSGVFFAVVLFRYGLLDLMPVARSLLVNEMPDGMLLIDRQQRVVDYNAAAKGILGIAGDPVGKKLAEVWPQCGNYLALPGAGEDDSLTRPDIMTFQRGNLRMAFALRVMPVGERRRSAIHHDPQGWMVMLTDVTRRVEAERGMSEANMQLRALNDALEARVQARTDALRARAAELEAVSRVSVALRRAVGMDDLLPILLSETIANVRAAAGAIFVVEGDDLVLRASQGLDARQIRLGMAHPRRGQGGLILAAGPAAAPEELAAAPEELAAAPESLHSQPAAAPESLHSQPAAPEELAKAAEELLGRAADVLWQVLETGQMLHRDRLPEPMVRALGMPGGPVIIAPIRAGRADGPAGQRALADGVAKQGAAPETLAAAPEELAAPESLRPQPAAPEELAAPESLHSQPAAPETLRPQTAAVDLAGQSKVLGMMVVCFAASDRRTEMEPDIDHLLTAIAEVGSNAFQRVRAMENLEQLVQQRTRHLATLYEITTVTNQFMELPDLLDGVLRTIQTVLGLRAVTLHVVEESLAAQFGAQADVPDSSDHLRRTQALRLAASVGMTAEAVEMLAGKDAPWAQAFARGGMVVQPRLAEPIAVAGGSIGACIGVPVRAKGQQLGVLTVLAESIGHFSAEDIALLGAIADQVGVAVESAQLRERAQQKAEEAAVMEERQRLARDLHDSVTQSLYSLVLFSEAVKDELKGMESLTPRLAQPTAAPLPEGEGEDRTAQAPQFPAGTGQAAESQGNIQLALENLEQLREAGGQALKEMRLLIYELRPQTLARDGLVGALRSRLEMVERRAGVKARLEVDGLFPLPDAVETGLFGIAQEALNNVLKHAKASEVVLRLLGERGAGGTGGAGQSGGAGGTGGNAAAARGTITLEVRDNGVGFQLEGDELPQGEGFPEGGGRSESAVYSINLGHEATGGVGLNSMRERARQMGGTIEIMTQPGAGTRVVARVDGIEVEEASI